MKLVAITLMFALIGAPALALPAGPPIVYAESFRHGTTRITEDSFETRLTPENRTYSERIKDSFGDDRYSLTITPQGPEGDTKITAWRVELADLRHAIYKNVLLADLNSASDPKNALGLLNPDQFAAVPVRARRIIKVDSFYVVMQVKDFHFTPLDSPYLDTMVVKVSLTNSDPRKSGS